MAEWYDAADENEGQSSSQEQGKGLRAQLEAQIAANKELKLNLAKAQGAIRTASIRDYFRDNGLNPKAAKYVPGDIEPTADALKAWVAEDGELFNLQLPAAKETPQGVSEASAGTVVPEVVSPELQAGYAALNASTAGAVVPGKEADMLAQMNGATTKEDLLKLIFSNPQ